MIGQNWSFLWFHAVINVLINFAFCIMTLSRYSIPEMFKKNSELFSWNIKPTDYRYLMVRLDYPEFATRFQRFFPLDKKQSDTRILCKYEGA